MNLKQAAVLAFRVAVVYAAGIEAGLSAPKQPWWEKETELTPDGRLAIPPSERSWWPRALALRAGESMLLTSEYGGEGRMLVQRRVGTPVPSGEHVWGRDLLQDGQGMIVWIIDDDGDMDPASPAGDQDSDAYVVDYGADGTVDRILDYIDEDGDNDPEVQDIRYFRDGELKQGLVQLDLDDDNRQYPIHDYQGLVGLNLSFLIDAYGDNVFYHNKYDPASQGWLPFGECPFAFFDTDGDGQSERAVRVSAGPLAFDAATDPDYANSRARMLGPMEPAMRNPGAIAVRYSLDIDGGSSAAAPLHYEMGFQTVGAAPYDLKRYRHFHALRRPPRLSYAIPHADAIRFADTYPATATGYSWREFPDATVQLGDSRGRPDYDQRWEGVFWTWQRHMMHNTGGPNQTWNVRREHDGDASSARELYFSPVDHRLHLKGAEDGWLLMGAIEGPENFGELRMFDTNGDGYFDRWEYWNPGGASSYRTIRAPDARNRDLGTDPARAGQIYVRELLPAALATNRKLVSVLQGAASDMEAPGSIQRALQMDISDVERLYLLDIARESLYSRLGGAISARAARHLSDSSEAWWLPGQMLALTQKELAWKLTVLKAQSDAAYEQGDFDAVADLVADMARLLEKLGKEN